MRYLLLIIVATFFFAGCSKEAVYVDHEYGMATMDALDRQVVYKDYRYASQPVEGMDGIHAEPIMETYHETFSDSFSKEDFDVTQTGAD